MNESTRDIIASALSRLDDSRQHLTNAVQVMGPIPAKHSALLYRATTSLEKAIDLLRDEYHGEG